MKVLLTLALVATGLSLSSCACKDGKCMFSKKKSTAASCCATPAKGKPAASCCSH